MRPLSKVARALALAVALTVLLFAQGAPVTLKRLTDALDSKLLSDKEVAEIVLEVGVAFRLTDELERDLRGRGASDLVILAVRNGFRPPLPPGPASGEAIAEALESGASSVDIVEHVESDGVTGPFDAALRERLEAAGASAVLQRIIASRWLESNSPDGSLEQIEALLAAGADPDQLSSKLGGAQLAFPVNRETFERLSAAGAPPAVLNAVATTFLEGAQEPLSLDQLVVLQGAGVDSKALAARIAEVGTDFESADDVSQQLNASGLDVTVKNAVLARRIETAEEPLTLQALVRGMRSGISTKDMVESIQRRGVSFTLTNGASSALTAFPAPIRLACVVQALGQQGYRAFRPARAAEFNPNAEQGSMDIRLMVDHVEDVVIVDDVVLVKALRGSDSSDAGSEISQPLPLDLDPNTFAVELKDGRGQLAAYWMPEKDNGFILRARIFDEKGGPDRYHMRLTWRRGGVNAGGDRREPPSLRK